MRGILSKAGSRFVLQARESPSYLARASILGATRMPITVLLVDDADALRDAVRGLLRGSPEVQIVGEAGSFAEAQQMATALKPQVVLLDLHLRDRLPADLKYLLPRESRILAMSLDAGPSSHAVSDALGAVALLDKMSLGEDLVPAIIKAANASDK